MRVRRTETKEKAIVFFRRSFHLFKMISGNLILKTETTK